MEDPDVIVIGGGLAGLTAALRLQEQGLHTIVLESSDSPGGRIRTDHVDGFLLDRGFQVLLSAYPVVADTFDSQSLDLQPFFNGASIWNGRRWGILADPFSHPSRIAATLTCPVGNLRDKILIARLRLWCRSRSLESILNHRDMTTAEFLRKFGFSNNFIDQFFRPFMGGVFLDPSLSVSCRFFLYLYRFFGSGRTCLPGAGMQAIPDSLVSRLKKGTVRCGEKVVRIDEKEGVVTTASGNSLRPAKGMVLAVDGDQSKLILGATASDRQESRWFSTTTVYYRFRSSARISDYWGSRLHLNGSGQGCVNSMVLLSQVAGNYAPSGWELLSVSLNGIPSDDDERIDFLIREECGRMDLPPDLAQWERMGVYRIPHALPAIASEIPFVPGQPQVRRNGASAIVLAGDHTRTPSIQGAVESGRMAADLLLQS
jgi:phytoene dehydrogenase-like protein